MSKIIKLFMTTTAWQFLVTLTALTALSMILQIAFSMGPNGYLIVVGGSLLTWSFITELS